MAAPAFVAASTGQVFTTGTATFTATVTSGNAVLLHIFRDGTSGPVDPTTLVGIANVAGTDSAITKLAGSNVGNPATGTNNIYFGRATSASISAARGSITDDLYGRFYEFSNVNAGTTVADIIENATAGSFAEAQSAGAVAAIADVGVTTLGVDRLALNLIGVDDDNALGDFTGETGGDWTLAASYGSATGTDGEIGLETAAMAAAGTINGGSFTMAAADSWGVVGFALIGTTSGANTYTKSGFAVESAVA